MHSLTDQIACDTRFQKHLQQWSAWFALVILLTGILVLVEWTFHISFLKNLLLHQVAMNPVTAVTLLLCALSCILLTGKKKQQGERKILGRLLAFIIATIGFWKLLNNMGTIGIDVDHLLFHSQYAGDALHGKLATMAPNTAVCFVLTGNAFLLLPVQPNREQMPSQLLALFIGLLALFSMIGYLYSAHPFYGTLVYIPMDFQTAISFLLLSLAILFSTSNSGMMKTFTNLYAGSIIGRLLVPAAIIVPVVLGLCCLYGFGVNILSKELGMAILVMSILVFFGTLFWYTIKLLNTRDAGKTKIENKFRDLLNVAPDATVIVDNTGTIQMMNLRAEELFWYKREELIGKPVELLIPEELASTHIKNMQTYIREPRLKLMGAGMALMAQKKNGDRFPVEISLSSLQTEKDVLISASIRDITDHWIIEQKLKQFSESLEHQVLERTDELRQLSAHLVEVREQERISISREIHDDLGQQLTALRMDLVWLSKKTPGNYELVKAKFPALLEMVDEMVNTVRRISTELRPPILDHFGLLSALEWYSAEFERRFAIKISLTIPDTQPTMPADIATGIFRVYQEALTNIARHAEASTVTTTITIMDNKLMLTIADDGKGFDPKLATAKKTLGLLGMRERILMMGGQHEITSTPGKGTLVSLTIPF